MSHGQAMLSRPKLLPLDEPSMAAPLMVQKVFETVIAIVMKG